MFGIQGLTRRLGDVTVADGPTPTVAEGEISGSPPNGADGSCPFVPSPLRAQQRTSPVRGIS